MGFFFGIFAAFCSTAKDLLSKHLTVSLDTSSSTFSSFAFALPFYVVALTVSAVFDPTTFWVASSFFLYVFLRSITDTAAEWLKMHSFAHGDISLVSSFLALSPVMLLFTSPFITGDSLTPTAIWATALVTLASLIAIGPLRSWRAHAQTRGVVFALCAAFFFSLNHCFDRLAVQAAGPVLSGFAMTLLSALFLAPLVVFSEAKRRALYGNARPLLSRGFAELLFMVSKLAALQYMQAPYVVALLKISLLFSIIGGKVAFQEKDFLRRLSAGLLVTIAIVLILWSN